MRDHSVADETREEAANEVSGKWGSWRGQSGESRTTELGRLPQSLHTRKVFPRTVQALSCDAFFSPLCAGPFICYLSRYEVGVAIRANTSRPYDAKEAEERSDDAEDKVITGAMRVPFTRPLAWPLCSACLPALFMCLLPETSFARSFSVPFS